MAHGGAVILLDTCVLLWLAGNPAALSAAAAKALAEASSPAFVSAISAWELALKVRKGNLKLQRAPAEWYAAALRHHALLEMPLTGAIALQAAALPPIHNDPCDRFLVATAQINHLVLLTPDPKIQQYPGLKTLW